MAVGEFLRGRTSKFVSKKIDPVELGEIALLGMFKAEIVHAVWAGALKLDPEIAARDLGLAIRTAAILAAVELTRDGISRARIPTVGARTRQLEVPTR